MWASDTPVPRSERGWGFKAEAGRAGGRGGDGALQGRALGIRLLENCWAPVFHRKWHRRVPRASASELYLPRARAVGIGLGRAQVEGVGQGQGRVAEGPGIGWNLHP